MGRWASIDQVTLSYAGEIDIVYIINPHSNYNIWVFCQIKTMLKYFKKLIWWVYG